MVSFLPLLCLVTSFQPQIPEAEFWNRNSIMNIVSNTICFSTRPCYTFLGALQSVMFLNEKCFRKKMATRAIPYYRSLVSVKYLDFIEKRIAKIFKGLFQRYFWRFKIRPFKFLSLSLLFF